MLKLKLPPDPVLDAGGIDGFATAFRAGELTSEQTTRDYLTRIQALDKQLGAFEYIAVEEAIAAARAVDQLRAGGTDLGPLMGLPITVKDLFTVDGMPMTAGSRIDISDIADPKEGPFIQALWRAGCVILGKTRMVEFAFGITGVSTPRGTPWNPCDPSTHRLPGGSSSGAGVAVAAGLCALAIGTDTGGSVRVPAALCGVFGLKTTFGLWPMQGAFPLAPELDSIGLLARSARDAVTAYAEITGILHGERGAALPSMELSRLRFGKPTDYFFGDLSPEVENAMATATARLQSAGVAFDEVVVPQARERERYFPVSMPVALLTTLGAERFEANKHLMDPVIARRTAAGLQTLAIDHLALEARRRVAIREVDALFSGYDAWVSPTTTSVAPAVAELEDPESGHQQALSMTRNTQPANYLGLCAATIPLPREAGKLPVGYQIMASAGSDARLLAIAILMEELFAASDEMP
ncbi:aspartyl-tRNA(Asn)/glutamyl-tRNA(Gln) amidotransferase subunit A [Modicisalibacter muralis]|uniref:Aspartyl-tRNA(Asn)/glutamyl-tRNA(Gln) amidotransferase subunit A n=1 Tax=Modicisalibacter muralis TaxID=119000 RepID=A0A1G9HUX1_9GAMM|nr:amidase [Halomonas muralis]SDL16616.1 aspartyl-tRNA(Asn)/glutamyl-tRNA(Gln) amidotransferase subunit A [Halomonas muralis]